ncbi:MAG: VWA domain-containing protein [Steroidobacteraceae bacterium]|nr:VWA domain-containing protein [Steroidobacteraceae bacterium]
MPRWTSLIAALAGLFLTAVAWSQSASLKAASTAEVGSTLEVRWTGPAGQGDFVSIDAAGAADHVYGPYAYPSSGNPLKLQVPTTPGNYEVRYHVGASGYGVLAKAPLAVSDVAATLEAPPTVEVGGSLKVNSKGPNRKGDFISIDAVGAPDRTYGNYAYPANGNPVAVRAPDQPGDYLLRYHLADSYRVIGSRPLKVGGVAATLKFPDNARAGGTLAVTWSGPGKKGDFISIDAVGAPERQYGNYAYPEAGNLVEVRIPDEPGDYVVRYHLASSYGVIGSAPLKVAAATASLAAPAKVPARGVFDVRWEGPDNPGDFVTVVAPATKDGVYGASNGYTQRGNPVRLEAPKVAGTYELRYLTGQSYRTLAKATIEVTPSSVPAKLRVVTDAENATGNFGAVEFVLDASGSMLQKLGGVRRIDLAKSALTDLARNALPDGTAFALRVFGNRKAGSCETDLDIALAPIDRNAAVTRIQGLTAMNLAKTPIGASLLKVRDDLKGARAPMLVVLVTDGEETCGGDPKAAIESLRAAGLDVRVNIVGFAVDEVVLKETFREWARVGNGGYFDAQDGEQLKSALRATLRPAYQVLAGARVIATGTVNGDPVEIPAGNYRVRLLGATAKDLGEVAVEGGALRELRY